MKLTSTLRNIKFLSFAFTASAAVLFSSCDKNNDPNSTSGKAQVRITNAVEGSASQELYLDGNKLSTSAVAYGSSSDYLQTNTGDRQAQFRNAGSADVNTAFSVKLENGKHYSVYYAGNASAKSSLVTEDDMSAPSSGKAKVRFVHLAAAVSNSVDFGLGATNKLFTNVAYKAASVYKEVEASSHFFLYLAGSADVKLDMNTTIQAGKIYTIYVSGSTLATLKYHVIAEN